MNKFLKDEPSPPLFLYFGQILSGFLPLPSLSFCHSKFSNLVPKQLNVSILSKFTLNDFW